VRRHRLVETFLVEVVGMSWDEVHREAELLEHGVSERLESRIDELLGHPVRDPHGDPIPPRDGPHREHWGDPLAAAAEGDRFRVQRVSDRDPAVLRYLATLQIRPGAVLRVEEVAPFGGPMWVRLDDGDRHALGTVLTHVVHGRVERDGPDPARAGRLEE
jgi:DtxR family Mn-dependent transcriptional regulator